MPPIEAPNGWLNTPSEWAILLVVIAGVLFGLYCAFRLLRPKVTVEYHPGYGPGATGHEPVPDASESDEEEVDFKEEAQDKIIDMDLHPEDRAFLLGLIENDEDDDAMDRTIALAKKIAARHPYSTKG